MGILNDELKNAREWQRTSEEIARRVEQDAKDAERRVETARKHGYKSLAENEDALIQQKARVEHIHTVIAQAKERVERAEKALDEVREARYAGRDREVREYLGITETGDLALRVSRGSHSTYYELKLLQMTTDGERVMKTYTDRDGVEHTYAEERFGFHADVSAPRKDFRGEWEFATVNWPSIGAQRVAEVEAFVRVLSTASKLADLLNVRCHAWHAEDMAD